MITKADNGKYFLNTRKIKVWVRKHPHAIYGFCVGIAAGSVLAYTLYMAPKVEPKLLSPCPDYGCNVSPTPTLTPKIVPTTSPNAPKKTLHGKASYYSVAGCLGCSPTLTMANGERLDDTRTTVAYNHAPLNSYLTVTNDKTGKNVRAKVTDRGGFERHGKIIDLSVATRDAIGCGDVCNVTINL